MSQYVHTPSSIMYAFKNMFEHSSLHEHEPMCLVEHLCDDVEHILWHLKDLRKDAIVLSTTVGLKEWLIFDGILDSIIDAVDDLQDELIQIEHAEKHYEKQGLMQAQIPDATAVLDAHRQKIHNVFHSAIEKLAESNIIKPEYKEHLYIK